MPNIDDVLEHNLTPDQGNAAQDAAKEVLSLACAGSGKSRTMAYRIARLLAQGEDPHSIVAFTFTDKAAESIKQSVAGALAAAGLEPTVLGAMYIGTIHSYCHAMLGEMDATYRQFEVLNENRLKLYLLSRYTDLGLRQLQAVHEQRGTFRGNVPVRTRVFTTIREVSNAWKVMNDELIRVEDVLAHDPAIGQVLQNLAAHLWQDQYIDFSLMIRLVVDALRQNDANAERAVHRLRHLMVDEYQDINTSQEALIRELHRRSATLFVVGDDDQAIYAWRGANVSNILTFDARYPQCAVHRLARNFRSTQPIVQAADRFAVEELGATRIVKAPEAVNPTGPRDFRVLWFPNRAQEAEWVAGRIAALLGTAFQERDGTIRGLTPGDFAILMRSTRTNEQDGNPRHHAFTQALHNRNISYSLEAGGGVFDRAEVRAMADTFELLRNGQPDRPTALAHFQNVVLSAFPYANRDRFFKVLTEWGRLIHAPMGQRQRVYLQRFVHDLLDVFGVAHSNFSADVMRDLGVFSKIIQDVETVYLSIDSASRFRQVLEFLQAVAETGYDTSTDDILRRPDAVTVSTVHKVKGLEFPVVFLVDVETGRFPSRRGSYSGWLPPAVVQPALDRGAYQSTRDEEARLFYTALTRAERYLYVTGAASLPGGVKAWKQSVFALRLSHPEVSDDSAGLPAGITPHPQIPRVDEAVVPTSYSDIRYYLRCPRDYQFRKSFGFSPPIREMFGFGMTVHAAVGKLHEKFPSKPPQSDEAEDTTLGVFHLKHVSPSQDPVNRPGPYERARNRAVEIIKDYAETYTEDFTCLREVEVPFEIPVEQAVISGSIDLILKEDEQGHILDATVVDFKAIEGGEEPEESEELHWTELALQVQLYAKAAQDILGENARTGAVHLLKDNQRVYVPVTAEAVQSAVANVEWAVDRILAGDFPMRPETQKCAECDFGALCPRIAQEFQTATTPPPIHVPGTQGTQMARAFSEFEQNPQE